MGALGNVLARVMTFPNARTSGVLFLIADGFGIFGLLRAISVASGGVPLCLVSFGRLDAIFHHL